MGLSPLWIRVLILKLELLIVAALLGIFMPAHVFAYEGTGMWNYSEYNKTNNCGEPNILESGEIGLLQTGGTFLIVGDDYSATGTVNGNTYTFSDQWCEGDGSVSETVTITLTSNSTGTGTVNWTYSEPGWGSCTGSFQLAISKQTQAAPVYDATGTWNFTQSGFSDNCSDSTPPHASGFLEVTQTGSRITAVDDQGTQFNGFVSGTQYAVVRSSLQNGGRVSEWGIVTLGSETQGSGEVGFVWDDTCEECWGNWQISMAKEVPLTTYAIVASATAGGTIAPSGTITATAGSSQAFQITASSGYDLSSVTVDGSPIGAVSSYTFTNISADHTIHAAFAPETHAITASATAGGTISPSGTIIAAGGTSQTFQINPASGYVISAVYVDGASVGAISSYTFSGISAGHTIKAVFALNEGACESLITQDFNGGVIPPSGWQLLTTNADNTWEPYALGGDDHAATVHYDQDLNPQDEVLFSPRLSIKEAILHFWSAGLPYWCRDTHDNCDLEVWLVVGDWDAGSGDDILAGRADEDWTSADSWEDSSFELTPLLPGTPIRIGFRYKGTDGAQIVLDDIQICSDKPAGVFLPFLDLLL